MARIQATASEKRILDAAATLVADGPSALTMEALADVTGLSRATLYRRVGSRAKLLDRLASEGHLDPASLAQDDVKTRVLEAMRIVLAREGMRGTTLDRVAAEAGVGLTTVYRHFNDREGLFAAFASRYSPRRLAKDLAESGQDLEADLKGLVVESLQFMHEHSELYRLRLSGDPEARRLLGGAPGAPERMMTVLSRYFERQIDAGHLAPADPLHLAAAFGGLVMGFSIVAEDGVGEPMLQVEPSARIIVELFLEGAKARSNPVEGANA